MSISSGLVEMSTGTNSYLHSKSAEKAAWIFGTMLFALLVIFISIYPNPSITQMGLIRYVTALSAAFLSFFFVGKLTVNGEFMGVAISATSGIAVFVGMLYFSDHIYKPSPQIVEKSVATSSVGDEPNTRLDPSHISGPQIGPAAPQVSGYKLTNLSQLPCDKERNLRSTASNENTSITFDNRSERIFNVFWLDYNSNRKFYAALAPGQSTTMDTWSTHFWLILNERDECIGIFRPQSVPGQLVLN